MIEPLSKEKKFEPRSHEGHIVGAPLQKIALRIDDLRLRLHFARVNLWLKLNSTRYESDKRLAREQQIAELRRYAQQSIFPRNHTQNTMQPCFIDRDDRRCAVAHLLIQSGYEDTARMIAAQANDAYVPEVQFPQLDVWAEQHGMTREELAVIQPAYPPTAEELSPLYQTLSWLGTVGIQYFVILNISLVCGAITAALSIYGWRRRWERMFPLLSLFLGITLLVVSGALLNVQLQLAFFYLQPRILDDSVTRLVDAARAAGPAYSPLSWIGLVAGLFFVVIGAIILVKYGRRSRRERQQAGMEVATA